MINKEKNKYKVYTITYTLEDTEYPYNLYSCESLVAADSKKKASKLLEEVVKNRRESHDRNYSQSNCERNTNLTSNKEGVLK